jgi:tripeptidyl-peptidase-1
VRRANAELLKLAARGVSVLASSGDGGAPGELNADCSRDAGPPELALSPDFPAASPYVLSVGATMLAPPVALLDPKSAGIPAPCRKTGLFSKKPLPCAAGAPGSAETVASFAGGARITSGGGFSAVSAQPAWQKSAVAAYLARNASAAVSASAAAAAASALPPAAAFNASNRAYPDVAALGKDFLVFVKDTGEGNKGWNYVDGTSASSPVWAGLITLLNDARAAVGKGRLGFLPPLLYAFAATQSGGFHDVTTGDNRCTRSACCKYGFPAAPGWDASTGLGTPNFEALKAYVMGLP